MRRFRGTSTRTSAIGKYNPRLPARHSRSSNSRSWPRGYNGENPPTSSNAWRRQARFAEHRQSHACSRSNGSGSGDPGWRWAPTSADVSHDGGGALHTGEHAEAETVHVGVLVERILDLAHPRRHRHAIVVEKRDERGARDADARIACVRDPLARLADVAERRRGPARDRAIDDRTRVLAGIVVGDDHFIADAAGLLLHQPVDHQLEIRRAVYVGMAAPPPPRGTPEIFRSSIPTYNRPTDLELVIDGLMRPHTAGISYEVIVADNNSGADTRAVVDRAVARGTTAPLRYVRERRQGVWDACNAGVRIARSPLIAFLDDDGVPAPTWVREVKEACDQHPDVDCFGFRVRAVWSTPPPSWLTSADLRARLPSRIVRIRRRSIAITRGGCLSSANLVCRRQAFDEVGGFSPMYPRSQDREFELRLWRAGKRGLYLPIAEVLVDVPRNRLTKDYHRRWHAVVAHYHAMMRYLDTIDASGRMIPDGTYRTWLGVPRHMYRACLTHVVGWLRAALTGRTDERFHEELRIRSYVSFFRTRWATRIAGEPAGTQRIAPRSTALTTRYISNMSLLG